MPDSTKDNFRLGTSMDIPLLGGDDVDRRDCKLDCCYFNVDDF